MKPQETLHVAAYKLGGRRDPHYIAIGVVTTEGYAHHHCRTQETGETLQEAIAAVAERVRKSYLRDGLTPPETVKTYGKLHIADVTGCNFYRFAKPD